MVEDLLSHLLVEDLILAFFKLASVVPKFFAELFP